MSNQIAENILKAADEIITVKLNSIKFDKTETCIIRSKIDDNNYYVSNGSLTFSAKTNGDTKYNVNDQVYVLIPQSDYTREKLITGKVKAVELTPKQVPSPLSNIISYYSIGKQNNLLELNTKNSKVENLFLDNISITSPSFGALTTVGFNLDFEVSGFELYEYSGTYSLLIEFLDNTNKNITTVQINSTDLYGNPYDLPGGFFIQYLFQLPKGIDISKTKAINLQLLTDNNFIVDNFTIKLNSLDIYIGYSLQEFSIKPYAAHIELSAPKLGVEEDYQFGKGDTTKSFSLNWYKDDKIYGGQIFPSPLISNYCVYWCQYEKGYQKKLNKIDIEESGVYWKTLQKKYANDLSAYFLNNFDLNPERDEEQFKVIIRYEKVDYTNLSAEELYGLKLAEINEYLKLLNAGLEKNDSVKIEDIQTFQQRLMALTKKDKQTDAEYKIALEEFLKENENISDLLNHFAFTSNSLLFKNKELKAPLGTAEDSVHDFELHFLPEGEDGNYNIYGIDNHIIGNMQSKANMVEIGDYYDSTEWNETEQVTWKIPINNTMILPSKEWLYAYDQVKIEKRDEEGNIVYEKDDKGKIKEDEDGNPIPVMIYQQLEEPKKDKSEKYYIVQAKNLRKISYTFPSIYSSTKVHNTIYCEIYREDKKKTYYSFINPTFGLANTNGGYFSLNIIPEHYGGLQSGKSIKYTALLEDWGGQKVEFEPNQLTWSWYYDAKRTFKRVEGYETPELDETQETIEPEDEDTSMEGGGLVLEPKGSGECIVTRTRSDVSQFARSRAILKATMQNWQNANGLTFNLEAYYPIGLGNKDNYLVGATRLIYNYDDTIGSYDQTPYELYNLDTQELIPSETWQILTEEGIETTSEEYPILEEIVSKTKKEDGTIETKVIGYKLSPLQKIITQVKPCYVRLANKEGVGHWWQPLLITRNLYASGLANEWNGKLLIKEDEATNSSYILAQTVGAGIKEHDNTYTGVLMGSVALNNAIPKYGLYGFKSGQLMFSFDEKGNGYLKGKIESKEGNIGGWDITENYLSCTINRIVQVDALPNMNQRKNWLVYYYIDPADKQKKYCFYNKTLNSWQSQPEWPYGLSDTLTTGLQTAKSGHWAIAVGSTQDYEWSSAPFKVDHEGNMYAANADITGKITATEGRFGGFTIASTGFGDTSRASSQQGSGIWFDPNPSSSNYFINCVNYRDSTKFFRVKQDGTIWASNAIIEGVINAKTGGNIGGWEIGLGGIFKKNDRFEVFLKAPTEHGIPGNGYADVLVVHDPVAKTYPIVISSSGTLQAQKAEIQGYLKLGNRIPLETGNYDGPLGYSQYTDVYVEEKSGQRWVGTMWANTQNTLSEGVDFNTFITSSNQGYSYILLGKEAIQFALSVGGSPSLTMYGYEGDGSNNRYGYLGGTWKSKDGTITTSDKNKKNSIFEIPDVYSMIFDNLTPVIYKYNESDSGRIHTGFVAQDVANAVETNGLTTMDFAAVCYSINEQNNKVDWGLRYEEFVALNTWQIQKLKSRVTELETLLREKGVI